MDLPRAAMANSPDLVPGVQHEEDWGAQVSKEEAVHCPVIVCKDNPAVGLS